MESGFGRHYQGVKPRWVGGVVLDRGGVVLDRGLCKIKE